MFSSICKRYRDDDTQSVFDVLLTVHLSISLVIKKEISPVTGPRYADGSRKLRFPDYVTMAQDGGKVVSLTHRPPLPTGNTPGTHFC